MINHYHKISHIQLSLFFLLLWNQQNFINKRESARRTADRKPDNSTKVSDISEDPPKTNPLQTHKNTPKTKNRPQPKHLLQTPKLMLLYTN